jgi:hypothetical protein
MTIASPAVRGAQRPLVATSEPSAGATPEVLRDELTRRQLLAMVDHLPDLVVEAYDRQWWDGQVRVPCLVVRGGRQVRRMRVVETDGVCVILPFSRRLARRWLAARRRPRRVELDDVVLRARPDVVVDAWADAVRCAARGCGALRPLAYPGCCPLCGG